MKAILLFDSSCMKCAKLASDVALLSQKRIEIRSLTDPYILKIAHQENLNLEWKPSLLIFRENKIELLTGWHLWTRLLSYLGLKQTLSLLLQTQRRLPISINRFNNSRREFLKQFSASLLALPLFGKYLFIPQIDTLVHSQETTDSPKGDLYNGFLILAEADQVPFVPEENIDLDGIEVVTAANFTDAIGITEFPLYALETIPVGVEFAGIYVEKNKFSQKARASFINYTSQEKANLVTISLIALADYHKPYPIRPVHKFKESYEEIEFIYPEKVEFTPIPGLMIPSTEGYLVHWIENDILYILISEHSTSREATVEVTQSLQLIS